MRSDQKVSGLKVVKVFANRDLGKIEALRKLVDEYSALLLNKVEDVLAPFFDEHRRAKFRSFHFLPSRRKT